MNIPPAGRFITPNKPNQTLTVMLTGESIVKPVGEVICIRKFPNFSDDTLTNQMLVCNVDVYC